MANIITFQGKYRDTKSKATVKAVRKQDEVPVVVYGKDENNIFASIDAKTVHLEYAKKGFFSTLAEINIGKDKIRAIPYDVQLHPVSDRVMHIDFLKVKDGQKIPVNVSINFINVEKSIGVKMGGKINIVRRDLNILCFPDNIPESITVDLGNIAIGFSIHSNDLELPKGVEISEKRNLTIASVTGRAPEKSEAELAKQTEAGVTPAADDKK